jgi:putative ABC transport system substrate-binding protein
LRALELRTPVAFAPHVLGAGLSSRASAFWVIGFLPLPHSARSKAPAPDSPLLSILRPKWRELGYVEGETILLRTAAGDVTRLPDLIKELVGLGSGVLIMVGPQAVRAAHATAPTTPVIGIDLETDPIRAGFIQSWAKPGGNVTGMFLDQASLAGKWVELLKEVEPRLARIALAWDGWGRRSAHAICRLGFGW